MRRVITRPYRFGLGVVGWLFLSSPLPAQIVPDGTLPTNSQVTPGCTACVINGGTAVGSTLFHSFFQFSVPTGGSAAFNNGTNIQSILTRVTGPDLSAIDGLLRTHGSANLFLLNPNGIILGPNARLDVQGSFVATTASSFKFADGSEFGAINPQAPPTLAMTVPLGLQYGPSRPDAILTNAGTLQVGPGQSLTLLGGITTNSGSLTAPGGTVQVLGDQVSLLGQSRIDVSGPTGGGTVLVGGGYQGQGALLNSRSTVVEANAVIEANALLIGDGGTVIIWSDGNTSFGGAIAAIGGSQGGNGGFVETSGKQTLSVTPSAQVSTSAPQGQMGTWLLDPENLEVVASGGTATLGGGPPLVNTPVDASTIDVTTIVGTAPTQTTPGSGLHANNITLDASTRITVSAGIDASAHNAGTGLGNLTLNAPNITLNAPIKLQPGRQLSGTGTAVTVGSSGLIQNGIDVAAPPNATTGALSTVTVSSGTFNESVTVGKNLNLVFNTVTLGGNLTANNALGLSGTLTTSGDNHKLSFTNAVTLNGPTTLTSSNTGGGVTFDTTVNGSSALTINAGGNAITFSGAVGGTTPLGAVILNSTGNTVLSSTFRAASLQTNAEGTTQIGGNVTTTGAQTYEDAVQLTAAAELNAGTGTLTLGALTAGDRALTLTADEINLGVADSVSGSGTLVLQPFTAGRAIALGGTTDNASSLDLLSSDINALANGFSSITVGRASDAGAVTFGGAVAFDDAVTVQASSFTLADAGLTITDGLTINASGITLSGTASITGDGNATLNAPTISLGAPITLGSGRQLSGSGTAVTVNSGGLIRNGIDVAATNATVTVNSGTYNESPTVNKNLNLVFNSVTLGGNLTTNQAIGLSGTLGTSGDNRSLTFNQAVTLNGTTSLASLGEITFGGTVAAEANGLALTANEINLGAANSVSGTGTLALQPFTASRAIVLGGSTDSASSLDLLTSDINALANGFSSITIGRVDGTGTISVGGSVTFKDPVTIRSDATNPNSSFTLNGHTLTISDSLNVNANIITLGDLSNASATATIAGNANSTITLTGRTGVRLASNSSITAPGGTVQLLGTGDIGLSDDATINVAGPTGGIIRIGIDGETTGNPPVNVVPTANVVTVGSTVKLYANRSNGSPNNLNAGLVHIGSTQPSVILIERGAGIYAETYRKSFTSAVPSLEAGTPDCPTCWRYSLNGSFRIIDGTISVDPLLSSFLRDPIISQYYTRNSTTGQLTWIDPTEIRIPAAIVEGRQTSIYLGEFFSRSGGFVLDAASNITIDPLTTSQNNRLSLPASSGAAFFQAGQTFSMNSADTIVTSGRDINITGANVTLGSINTAGISPVNSGNIYVQATNGGITALPQLDVAGLNGLNTSSADGPAGRITLLSTNGGIEVSRLNTSSTNNLGGSVFLTATGSAANPVNIAATEILSTSNINGNSSANVVNIRSAFGSATFDNATIKTSNSGTGLTGQILIHADNTISLTNSNLSANGSFGQIALNYNPNAASGENPILPGQTVLISGSNLNTATNVNNTSGQVAGSLQIHGSSSVSILENSFLSSGTGGAAAAGRITVRSGGIATTPAANTSITIENSNLGSATEGSGSAGSIVIQDANAVRINRSNVLTNVGLNATGSGGNIEITNVQTLTLENRAKLQANVSSTQATSVGGNITVNATGGTSLNNSLISVATEGASRGGKIDITTGTLALTNNSALDATVRGTGSGSQLDGQPAISVKTTSSGTAESPTLSLDNSQISTSVSALPASQQSGDGGDILVNAAALWLSNGARIQSQTQGTGNAGKITIGFTTSMDVSGQNSFGLYSGVLTSSEAENSGRGNDILINSPTTPGGRLTVSNGGFLAASTRSSNPGGDIKLYVDNLNLNEGGQILTAALKNSAVAGRNTGSAGEITVNARNGVSISGSTAALDESSRLSPFRWLLEDPVQTTDAGTTGGLLAATETQFVRQRDTDGFAYYVFNVSAAGGQGTFDIDGGFKSFSNPASIDTQLFLFDYRTGQLLNSNDDSLADAGSNRLFPWYPITYDSFLDYTFTSPGKYVLGVGAYPSSPSVISEADGSVRAAIGGQTPQATQTYVLNVQLDNPGIGGTVNPLEPNPNIVTQGRLNSGLFASSESVGGAGNVTINTPNLTLDTDGRVSVATSAEGSAGDIKIQPYGAGRELTMTVDGQISASTTGLGAGGDLIVTAPDAVLITATNPASNGILEAETTNNGPAGNILIETPTLTLEKGVRVSATATRDAIQPTGSLSTSGAVTVRANTVNLLGGTRADSLASGLFSETLGAANAGSITLEPFSGSDLTVRFANNAQVSASTSGSGAGGNLTVSAPGSVVLTANDSDSGILKAEASSSGPAGSIRIATPTLTVERGVRVSATATVDATQPTGASGVPFGNVTVLANIMNLLGGARADGFDSGLFSETLGAARAGNITLQPYNSGPDLTVRFENNAQVSASTTGSGAGGNLTIQAPGSVVLTANDSYSGILKAEANSSGPAGNIRIATPTLTVERGVRVSATATVNAIQPTVPPGTAYGDVMVLANTMNLLGGARADGADSGLFSETLGAANAGSITLQPYNGGPDLTVWFDQDARVSASTSGSGNGGNLSVIAPGTIRLAGLGSVPTSPFTYRGSISADTTKSGQAGDVNISARNRIEIQNRVNVSATSTASTAGGGAAGQAGRVSVITDANGQVIVDDSTISNSVVDGSGNNVAIASGTVALQNNTQVTASTTGGGQAGDVNISARNRIEIQNQVNVSATSTASTAGGSRAGQAGRVSVTTDANGQVVVNDSTISNSVVDGSGNNVVITSGTVALQNNTQVTASTTGGGQAGAIQIRTTANDSDAATPELKLENSQVLASTSATQAAGTIDLVAENGGDIAISQGSTVSSSTSGSGDSGKITVNGQNLAVTDGSVVQATSQGVGSTGAPGDIQVDIPGTIRVAGINSSNRASEISTLTGPGADLSRTSGNIRINQPGNQTSTLNLDDRGRINAQTDSTRPDYRGGDVNVYVRNVRIRSGGQILASSSDRAGAGSINVAANRVEVSGTAPALPDDPGQALNSGIFAQADGTGDAGSISVTGTGTDASLRLADGAKISASTVQGGQQAPANVRITNFSNLTATNAQISASTESGVAGDVTVDVRQGSNPLVALNNSTLEAQATGTGNAGGVLITTPILTLQNNAKISASTVLGRGGNIELPELRVLQIDNSTITASTVAGQAGSLNLQVANATVLNGQAAGLFVSASQGGLAGSLTLKTPQLFLQNGAEISVAAGGTASAGDITLQPLSGGPSLAINVQNGKISGSTTGSGRGGSINVGAPQLITLDGNGQISVATSGSGPGGNITFTSNQLDVKNGAQISASSSGAGDGGNITVLLADALFLDGPNTGLFASTTANSSGRGGSIFIDPRLVQITNGAGVSVDSRGSGNGGNLDLIAGTLNLSNQAFLSASTASGEGGNISLKISEFLFLRHGSLISATAGGSGNGGNLNINAMFIIGVPRENSDIVANAFRGRGGNINITTQGILGLTFRPRLTSLSDITASSDFGVNGVININAPGIDPTRGLTALPTNLADPANQIAQSCAVGRSTAERRGEFTVTGRGGLPSSPEDALNNEQPLATLIPLVGSEGRQASTGGVPMAISPPDPMVEAQGWAVASDGNLQLVSQPIGAIAHPSWQPTTACSPQ